MTTGQEHVPIYHIGGERNLADLLTKHHDITIPELSIGSVWQEGHPWMQRDSKDFPMTSYEGLRLEKSIVSEIKIECYQDPYIVESNPGTFMVSEKKSCNPPPPSHTYS